MGFTLSLPAVLGMGQYTTLTLMMRLPVAIAGTLMVPAMYFLAVQLVSKKTALVATLFTACSAYMLNYSRDAKMYMDTWLFVTLNVACLLWWLRTRLRVAWWAWVLSGVIMVGLQAVALAILPIELIIVLTARSG
jgi:4-amino-4-deoxy-L-arabinose transferase-like glycosyltransferase